MTRLLTTPAELSAYDARLRAHRDGTLWQSLEWKAYQESLGREVRLYVSEKGKVESEPVTEGASALVVIDRTIGGFSTWEIPRGPVFDSVDAMKELLTTILADAKKDKCLALYLSPLSELSTFHFPLSPTDRRVHAEATRIVDLTKTEEEILSQMHQKGRYNIGVARKGVEVMEGGNDDAEAFYELLRGTGGRDGFVISQQSHYTRFVTDLRGSFLLLAKHQGMPIAGLLGVIWPPPPSPRPANAGHPSPGGRGAGGEGATGIYYYGASSYEYRHLMAPYLLQWEAMRRCKAAGCTTYDLLGISPEGAGPGDPWAGISDFKRKFGGTVVMYPREQSVVMRPVLKRALELKRKLLG